MFPKRQNFTQTLILFSILLVYSFGFSHQQACSLQDQSSLTSFFANISISSPFPPLNWSSSISCCLWEGVECNIVGKVTHLQLASRGMEGLFTSSIYNLIELTHLNLSDNYLYGTLREGISKLTNLRILDLSSNNISGSIPREIGNLLHLEKLHLDANSFSGLIPSSLTTNCTNLVEIILRINQLSGDISKLDFSRLVQLQKLDLRVNGFSGTLPESIYSCKSLVAIGLARNNITGQISSRVIGLKSLSYLSLTQNRFTNITATLRVLAKCKNLKTLLLTSNFFGEPLPISINFTSFDGFPKLEYFDLGYCNFGGPIPDWISKLKGLRYLNLSSNKLMGIVPDWLGTLPNLISLILGNNNFSGNFPLNLCHLPALVSPTLDPNLRYFHFDLPTFRGTPNRTQSNGFIFGDLDLTYNAFSGNIPSEIGNLINLQGIDLSNNNFFGDIPMSISNLKNLEHLSLSTNNLSGGIPTSLGRLSFLSEFDVSYNNLQGPIPTGGQFSTFPESGFEGNPGLCGEPLNRSCFTEKRSGPEERVGNSTSHFSKQAFLDGLYVGFGSGFSVVIAILTPFFWLKYYRHIGPC